MANRDQFAQKMSDHEVRNSHTAFLQTSKHHLGLCEVCYGNEHEDSPQVQNKEDGE